MEKRVREPHARVGNVDILISWMHTQETPCFPVDLKRLQMRQPFSTLYASLLVEQQNGKARQMGQQQIQKPKPAPSPAPPADAPTVSKSIAQKWFSEN